jgi:phosphoribosylformylglycinamidine cyclo-ligase
VHAAAHITGGGFAGNVPRSLPEGMRAVIDRSSWEVPAVFGEIRALGDVDDDEMSRVFNLGLGMILMVGEDGADAAIGAMRDRGVDARRVGRVIAGERGVEFVGRPFWADGGGGRAPTT